MLEIQTFLQKKFHTLVMWLVVIGKWKNNVNNGSKWKPIKVNHINNLKKYCKIICDYNISQYILP